MLTKMKLTKLTSKMVGTILNTSALRKKLIPLKNKNRSLGLNALNNMFPSSVSRPLERIREI